MTDLAATLECVVCGRWWISCTHQTTAGAAGSILCPGCHVPCEKCGAPLTVKQIHTRRTNGTTTPYACSHRCAAALIRRGAPA